MTERHRSAREATPWRRMPAAACILAALAMATVARAEPVGAGPQSPAPAPPPAAPPPPGPATTAPASSAPRGAVTSGTPQTAGPVLQISMDNAVQMALEASLGLKSSRLDVNIAEQGIIGARASFLPVTGASIQHNSASQPVQAIGDGTTTIGSSTAATVDGSVSELLPWYGGSYQVSWSANRDTTGGGAFSTFNPRLGSTFEVSFSQPLWRNLSTDQSRTSLDVSARQRTIADITLQQRIVQTQASVKSAYLGLVEAIEGRKVAQENIDLAQESLHDAQERVAVGQAPPIDIITAQALVESNREQLIIADASIATAEDQLRSQILDPARPDYWQVHIEPTDAIQLTPRTVDGDAAVKNALENRLDLIALKRNIEITDLNINLNRNLTHPTVNAGLTYSATGSGGTQLINGASSIRPFTTVLGDAFSGAYPNWTVGVNVGYPIGRTAAEANLATSELQKRQQQLGQRQMELSIVSEVRQAVRDVQTDFERVQATQAALAASQQQLDAERRRFEVGLSDTFTLQSRESQLSAARVTELNATIAYNSALIELDRVQKIP